MSILLVSNVIISINEYISIKIIRHPKFISHLSNKYVIYSVHSDQDGSLNERDSLCNNNLELIMNGFTQATK